MTKIPFRTAYDGKRNSSDDIEFDPEGMMTRQAHKDECDINVIMSQYEKSGLLAHVNEYQGEYADYDEIDFHEAMNTVVKAEQMFESVPSSIREKFNNDPGKFLDAVTHEETGEATLRELGLLPSQKKAPEAPGPAPLVVKGPSDSVPQDASPEPPEAAQGGSGGGAPVE